MNKLNQIVQHFYTKAVLAVLRARVDLPVAHVRGTTQPKVDRWFGLDLDDTTVLRDVLRPWRSIDLD
ncbi:autophagy protein 13, partial [Ascosphaera acerosa]